MWSMPHGCGTWPAYWTVGDNWPNNGEIDIVEGVNEYTFNQITAHTGAACQLPSTIASTVGRVVGKQCQTIDGNNAGCAFVTDHDNSTYGHGFNMNGGGVYAHIWDEQSIKVWFFTRQTIPDDINKGTPNPDSWGTPYAVFPGGDSCNIAENFKQHNIVFDITLCGDWAGNAYASSGCPGTCAQAVADPTNFKGKSYRRSPFFVDVDDDADSDCGDSRQVQDQVPQGLPEAIEESKRRILIPLIFPRPEPLSDSMG